MFGKLIKKQDSQEVVGNAVLELRKSMGLTQKELADRVGKPQSTIARIETGNMAPSFSLISDIATALNKKLNINFEDRDDKELMWMYPLVIFGYETKEVGKGRIQLYKWANKLVEKFNAFLKMNNLQATFLDFTMSYAKISFRYNIDFEQEVIPKEKLEALILVIDEYKALLAMTEYKAQELITDNFEGINEQGDAVNKAKLRMAYNFLGGIDTFEVLTTLRGSSVFDVAIIRGNVY